MSRHCVVGWLLPEQKWQNGELSIHVADDGGENDCGERCQCWCHIGSRMVGTEIERTMHLQNHLIENEEFELILLAFPPLRPVFPRLLSILSS